MLNAAVVIGALRVNALNYNIPLYISIHIIHTIPLGSCSFFFNILFSVSFFFFFLGDLEGPYTVHILFVFAVNYIYLAIVLILDLDQ